MPRTPSPAGGASTFRGAEFQLLWSLFHATEWTIQVGTDGFTAVLEPASGADLEYRFGQDRRVEQIKARSTTKPWSLDEVLGNVLPSLFPSVDPLVRTAYVFVTEGVIGNWHEAYAFFQSLRGRDAERSGIEAVLVPRRRIHVGRRSFTERSLFAHAVRKVAGEAATPDQTMQVWQLLRDFHFDGQHDFSSVALRINRALMNQGVAFGDLKHKRQELLGDLLSRAAMGGGRLDSGSFFREHDLSGVSLSRWMDVLARARRYLLEHRLATFNYQRELDVRVGGGTTAIFVGGPHSAETEQAGREAAAANSSSAILLTGDSGMGKSWQLYRLAYDLVETDQMAILIRATGDIATDIETIGAAFCRDIWGAGTVRPLRDVAALVRQELPTLREPWLTILIDGVEDETYALSLLEHPWQTMGARVVLTARQSNLQGPPGTQVVAIPAFTVTELSAYLEKRLGVGWIDDLPEYLWTHMRVPLFARLFCDVQGRGATWKPASEYQVFEQAWLRQTAGGRIAAAALAGLAARLPQDGVYPWPMAALRAAGLRDNEIEPFLRSGFLRPASDGRCVEIWHDRLLNWAVAEGLVAAFRAGDITMDTFVARALEEDAPPASRRRLGYVAMDTLWLLAAPELELGAAVREFLAALTTRWTHHMLLNNLPTLGPRLTPHLFALLEAPAAEGEE